MEIKGLGMVDQMRMIRGVDGIYPQKTPAVSGSQESEGVSFAEYLESQFEHVNQLGIEADQKVQQAITGGDVNPHETMIALQKADISFRLMLSVKEKLIQAYQQIVRTPIG